MLKITIVSPLEKITDTAELLIVDTVTGQRGILKEHAPILSQLKDNSLVVLRRTPQGDKSIRIGRHSFFTCSNNEAVILTQNLAMVEY